MVNFLKGAQTGCAESPLEKCIPPKLYTWNGTKDNVDIGSSAYKDSLRQRLYQNYWLRTTGGLLLESLHHGSLLCNDTADENTHCTPTLRLPQSLVDV